MANRIDASNIIEKQGNGPFVVLLMILISATAFLEGFDAQIQGYTAPTIVKLWHISQAGFSPVFVMFQFGLMAGAISLGNLGLNAALIAKKMQVAELAYLRQPEANADRLRRELRWFATCLKGPLMADSYNREDAHVQPPLLFSAYASTVRRAPAQPLIRIPQTVTETSGPAECWDDLMGGALADMTKQHKGEPLGQRIIVTGRVLDENARPVPDTVIEIWQANAAGRYIHARDNWPAPLDPNFTGVGRVVSDAQGWYRYITVRPGAYPWGNHHNAWRPAHIHLSLLGPLSRQGW